MNNKDHECQACGSHRTVKGRFGGRTEHGRIVSGDWSVSGLVLSEAKQRPLTSFIGLSGPVVPIRQEGEAILCLDCGVVQASLTADIEKAEKVVNKWGSSELRARLQIDSESV
jgi:hypothetical protein